MKTAKLMLPLLSLFFVSLTASANSVIVSCTIISGPTELNGTVVCPQFNGSGLSSVRITVSGGIDGSIMLTNNAATAETATGTTSSAFDVGALAGFTFTDPIFMASYTTGSQSLTGGQSKTFSGLTATGSASLGTDATIFGPYTGGGTFSISVDTLTGFALTDGGGNISGGQSTAAEGTAAVTYTFGTTGVTPEPNSLMLLGTGFLGLMGMGLYRKRLAQG